MESWVSVHAALLPIEFKAQIGHQITLQSESHTSTQTQSQMKLCVKSGILLGKIKQHCNITLSHCVGPSGSLESLK